MITRRDFLDGVAIGIGSALVGCGGKSDPPPPSVPDYAPEQDPDYYPPARTGMRELARTPLVNSSTARSTTSTSRFIT